MLWSEAQAGYLAGVDSVTAVVTRITDFAAPGLGAWDVLGLTGHLLRAIRTPAHLPGGARTARRPAARRSCLLRDVSAGEAPPTTPPPSTGPWPTAGLRNLLS